MGSRESFPFCASQARVTSDSRCLPMGRRTRGAGWGWGHGEVRRRLPLRLCWVTGRWGLEPGPSGPVPAFLVGAACVLLGGSVGAALVEAVGPSRASGRAIQWPWCLSHVETPGKSAGFTHGLWPLGHRQPLLQKPSSRRCCLHQEATCPDRPDTSFPFVSPELSEGARMPRITGQCHKGPKQVSPQ